MQMRNRLYRCQWCFLSVQEMHMMSRLFIGEILLICGAVFGIILGTDSPGWLQRYALSGVVMSASPVLLGVIRGILPLTAILCAVFPIGIIVLPLLLLFRGLVLGNGAALLISADVNGFFIALFVLGVSELLSLPTFLMLCAEGTAFSNCVHLRHAGRRSSVTMQRLLFWFLISEGLIPVCVLLEIYIVPFLVSLL